ADEVWFDCEVDEIAALRSPRDYRVVGKPAPRRDLPDKIAGRPRFIQDMALPGMLYGRVVRPPHNFAGLISLDDSKVKSMPGLAAIVRDGGFVGVLAEREDVAISAQRALRLAASWREVDPPPRDVHTWLKEHAAEHRVISEKENADARSRATRALEAALLARAARGRPVQVQWMRDDEFAWAPCGPAMALSLRAALDAHGGIVDWEHELWSNGHSSRPGRADDPALLAAWHLARPHK